MTESDYIEKIGALWPLKDTEAAEPLCLVEEGIRAYPTSAKLQCLRGDLIQLSDGQNYQLADALVSYERAAELDPCCAEAHESIGYYGDVLSDELQRAEMSFRRAVDLGAGADSYAGLARVLAERGRSKQEILALLDACPCSDSPKIREMRTEIERGCWQPR